MAGIGGRSGRVEGLDTDRLVERAQAGDREAFGALYKRFLTPTYNRVRAIVGNRDEAEDVVQNVFAKLLETLHVYEPQRGVPFEAWLGTVSCNEAKMQLRKNAHSVPEPLEIVARRIDEATALGVEAEQFRYPDEPESLDWVKDHELHVFVDMLSEAQRQVIVLRYHLGYEVAEIARVMNRSTKAIGQLEYRARRRLEAHLRTVHSRLVPEEREAERVPMRIRLRQMPVSGARRTALSRVLGSPLSRPSVWGR